MPDPPPFSPGQPPPPPGQASYGPPQGQGPIPGQYQPPAYPQGYPPGPQLLLDLPLQELHAGSGRRKGVVCGAVAFVFNDTVTTEIYTTVHSL
jgi:hypothetical protein